MPVKTVSIVTDEKNPIPEELIAQAIIRVSEAFLAIQKGKLTQRVIILLIKDQCTGMSINDIKRILDIVPKLKDIYLKKA